jgi:ribulose-phosphate 3-epimerase
MSWTSRFRAVEVAPSLYAANFWDLGTQIDALLNAGTRVFHYDVGDGHFVPPVTIGPIVLESIAPPIHERGATIDCHLMVEAPERHFEQIAAAGGDSVTVHCEAVRDLAAASVAARRRGLGFGVAFNPETAPEQAAEAASDADLVLCMSIHPGYSGQQFMPETVDRIRRLRQLLPNDVLIQVDGGVDERNANELVAAGARLLVVGSHIFGARDVAGAYRVIADRAGARPTPEPAPL